MRLSGKKSKPSDTKLQEGYRTYLLLGMTCSENVQRMASEGCLQIRELLSTWHKSLAVLTLSQILVV